MNSSLDALIEQSLITASNKTDFLRTFHMQKHFFEELMQLEEVAKNFTNTSSDPEHAELAEAIQALHDKLKAAYVIFSAAPLKTAEVTEAFNHACDEAIYTAKGSVLKNYIGWRLILANIERTIRSVVAEIFNTPLPEKLSIFYHPQSESEDICNMRQAVVNMGIAAKL